MSKTPTPTPTEPQKVSFDPKDFVEPSVARLKSNYGDHNFILDPQDPADSAGRFLCKFHTRRLTDSLAEDGKRTLHHHRGRFYSYTRTGYQERSDEEILVWLWEFLKAARQIVSSREGDVIIPFKPTKYRVENMLSALKAEASLPDEIGMPVLLSDLDEPVNEVVALQNCLLNLADLSTRDHTPDFFGFDALPFRYTPNAPPPKLWLKFLNDLWGDDRESIETLQEWFGYCLTADTSQQKMLMVIGPKRSGKGTIARIQSKLLGRGNVCAPTLSSLTKTFGLQNLINKRLAVVSDARLNKGSVVAEKLLGISGEDAVDVARKFCTDWHGNLSTRFMIMSNELPRIWDASGALASRFIILQLTESFYGKEDPQLTSRLATELPGILNWAIEGWQRLHRRRYFIQPKSSGELALELENLGSPVTEFVHECCVVGDFSIGTDELFDAWKKWCDLQSSTPGSNSIFGKNLRAAVPSIKRKNPRDSHGKRPWVYVGVKLQ